jgi:hypothetical protein
MIPFWLMFLAPLVALLTHVRPGERKASVAWWAVGVCFTLMIGLRYEVGGDWFRYLDHFYYTSYQTFPNAVSIGDPGHFAVNWLVAWLGGDIYVVNLLYAIVVMAGTMAFCRRQPRPWLALLVAVPYMLVVVGMGYTRQAVALGFVLLGLVALSDRRVAKFIFWVALGALFHKSAVLLLPIAALAASRNRWLTAALVAITFAVLYLLLVAPDSDEMWRSYVEAGMESEGAHIRVLMCVIPALIFLAWKRRLTPDPNERRLWLVMSLIALVCLPGVFMASTAIDRVALYLLPIQIYVFSRLPDLGGKNPKSRSALMLSVVGGYAAVLGVWLLFASHAGRWLPYQFAPFA